MSVETRATVFTHIDDERCRGFVGTVELVGRKWNSGILLAAVRGARRFVEYRAMLPGISDRVLTQRLRELEAEGLIERTVTPTVPVLVQYLPTERGLTLLRALQPLVAWGEEDRAGSVLPVR